ncbi:MAG: helix-turn-helix domain-containing protein [Synechococcales cyanobacterium]
MATTPKREMVPSDCLPTACPIQYTLDLIGTKWSILILRELFTFSSRRPHDLQAALGNISSKVLTERLRQLEQHGLISRHVYAEVPPRVDYELTAKGRELQPVLQALYGVGVRWQARDPCGCPLVTEIEQSPSPVR